MKKYFCDKCGKEIKEEDIFPFIFLKKDTCYNILTPLTQRDICESCYEEIMKILGEK